MLKALLLVAITYIAGVQGTGNTTCKTTSLDWYSESVGESPCRTYERLRQLCNSQYQVDNLSVSQPVDVCDDEQPLCCCSSVAFALAMLCLNCQYGTGSGVGDDTGLNAPVDAYRYYRGTGNCKVGSNQSLPILTQAAVCEQGIKIPKPLYTIFWKDGSWAYQYTKDTMQLSIRGHTNTSTACRKTTASTTSSSESGQATTAISTDSNDSSSPNIGAIIGGVVGGIGLIIVVALVWWYRKRQRRSRQISNPYENTEPQMAFGPYDDTPAAPAPHAYMPGSGPNNSAEYAHFRSSSNTNVIPPSSGRRIKPGMAASRPPAREEPRRQTLASSSSERHEDSETLTGIISLGRSDSGRLPPSYEQR